jgi:hypothetical protein
MIPTNHFEAMFTCGFFSGKNVFRGHRKAIAGGILPAINKGKKLQNLSRGSANSPIALKQSVRITAKQRAATFMRIRFRAVCANFLREMSADPEFRCVRHNQSSSQKRSFKYFDAESAKTVTITAFPFFGIPAATLKQPSNAAAALGLTSRPSSRANRFTNR